MKHVFTYFFLLSTLLLLNSSCVDQCQTFTPELVAVNPEFTICRAPDNLISDCNTIIPTSPRAFRISTEFTTNNDCEEIITPQVEITNVRVWPEKDLLINNNLIVEANDNLLDLLIESSIPVFSFSPLFTFSEGTIDIPLSSGIFFMAPADYTDTTITFQYEITLDGDVYQGRSTFTTTN